LLLLVLLKNSVYSSSQASCCSLVLNIVILFVAVSNIFEFWNSSVS